MIDLTSPVSCRQFAKMVGRAESAARKAVGRGSIIKGYYTPTKQFIPEVAAREWGVEILPEFGGKKTAYKAPVKPTTIKRVKPDEDLKVQSADDIVKELMNEKPVKNKSVQHDENEDISYAEGWPEEEDIAEDMPKTEAERRTAILKAQMLELALKEKLGQVVASDKIQTILFAYGAEIRSAVEGITNAVLDQVRAADERHESKRIMDEYINDILTSLSNLSDRNL